MNKIIVTALLALMISAAHSQQTLFTHCSVYQYPDANSILCREGRIEIIGSNLSAKHVKTIDLQGGVVYPGFTDAHLHLVGLGWSLEVLDLVGTSSVDEILYKVAIQVGSIEKDHWVQGRGWDQNDWEDTKYPTKEMLDSIAPQTPVYLRRIDGHAAWVNSKTFELVGITTSTQSPEGGKILRDNEGNPTGILIDNAMELVAPHIPISTEKGEQRQILKAASLLNTLGITGVHDAGTSRKTIEILQSLIKDNLLPIRVYAMLNDTPEDAGDFLSTGTKTQNQFLNIRSVKLYMDGALGSRGAALLQPYSDDPRNSGLILTDSSEIAQKVRQANAAGFQVGIHCIGDRANRIALDIFEQDGDTALRNRIEHAQIVHKNDIPRFAKLGVLPSMQPTHCTSDMDWVDDRLGNVRLEEAYPWRSLIRAGSIIPGGSDAPVEFPNPLAGIHAAVTRQDKNKHPHAGWQSDECISIDQAINMYTSWAAYASFEEDVKGKIAPGFYADFTVLDTSLETISPDEILNTNVLFTIVNGKVVYSSTP